MEYAGVSRPASGGEHYISHVWDMRGLSFGSAVDLHGIQCAVGTRYTVKAYEQIKALTPDVKAARAYAFTIGERQIGVYKYDSNNEKHKERLLRVDETGYFYVVGIRYNAIRNGSYILIDFEKHPRKNDIVNAFKTF